MRMETKTVEMGDDDKRERGGQQGVRMVTKTSKD